MSVKQFAALLGQYCQHHGIGSADKILAGAPLIIDGTAVVLRQDVSIAPSLAYAYCDLGLPTPGDEKELMRKLLLANLDIHFASGQSLMISPSTGHILLARDFDLRDTTVDMLSDMLVILVATASDWQHSRFVALLGDEGKSGQTFKRRASAERSRFAQIPQAGPA